MSEAQGKKYPPRVTVALKNGVKVWGAAVGELWVPADTAFSTYQYLSKEEAEAMVRGAEEKIKKLEWQLGQFKMVGTDGCETCYTGRVDVFQANKRCIQCAPDDYDTYEQRQDRAQKEQA